MPNRLALFPGAWNPPTTAHLALATAALDWADEAVLVIPRAFPHKGFGDVGLAQRLEMLGLVAAADPRLSVATTDGGLYREMADEARAALGPAPEIALVCGRDAAERIATWDYGRPGFFEEMIELYPLLVAGRLGHYVPDAAHAARIVTLPVAGSFDHVSSTEVRGRLASGYDLDGLVPAAIEPLVRRLYTGTTGIR